MVLKVRSFRSNSRNDDLVANKIIFSELWETSEVIRWSPQERLLALFLGFCLINHHIPINILD